MMKITENRKVSLLCPSFSGGGAEKVMLTLANKFVELGVDVDFVVGRDIGPYKERLNTKVNKVILRSELEDSLCGKIKSAYRLIKYLRLTDSVASMSTIREFNIFCFVCYIISRANMTFAVREAAALDFSHKKSSFTTRVLIFFMKRIYKKSDMVIANSDATKNDLVEVLGLLPNKVIKIYNPLDIHGKDLVHKENIKRSGILAVGRLTESKNFSDLLDAFYLVKKSRPNMHLTILGEGPEKQKIVNKIELLGLDDSVTLKGFVNNPYPFYRNAEVFVQTSLKEGFGYVLAEAMACGTPVVAYDSKGAMREILASGKYGILTPVGDLEKLADAISQQIETPTPKDILQESVKRFDVDRIARQYLDELGIV